MVKDVSEPRSKEINNDFAKLHHMTSCAYFAKASYDGLRARSKNGLRWKTWTQIEGDR